MRKAILLILFMTPGFGAYSQKPVESLFKKEGRVLQFSFETLASFFVDSAYYHLAELTKEKALEYDIDEIRVGGILFFDYLAVKDFPLLKSKPDDGIIAAFRKDLQWFKDRGIKVTIYVGGEPKLPGVSSVPTGEKSFFDYYPEARYLDSGLLWKFLEERTYAFFQLLPEADAMSFHLWETPLLDDLNYFTGIKWQKAHSWWAGPNQYYSQADYLTEMISAFSRGAQKAGKELSVLSFCHYPHQEDLVIESFAELERRNVPVTWVHKSQPGDWDPYRGPNNVLLNTENRSMMLFDGVGEYWGGSRAPYCFPEEIQYRLQHALTENKNINSVAIRVFDFFDYGTLFGSYNEINMHAMARLAEDPSAPVEEIWKEWADNRFGKEAAPVIVKALKRTDDIGKLVYYFKGIWVQQHSLFAVLEYMKAQVLHTGRAMLDWYPDHVIDNGMIRKFMFNPTEEIIQAAVNDRTYALDLCKQSIQDVESVKKLLNKEEYRKLIDQLHVQKKFVEVSILHIEAYLRYKINQNNPENVTNKNKLQTTLTRLEEMAKDLDDLYGESERLLSCKRIEQFVSEIRMTIPTAAIGQNSK